MPRKECSICTSPEPVQRIVNQQLAGRVKMTDIAAASGFSKSAVHRHSSKCLGRAVLRDYRDALKAGPRIWVPCWTPEEELSAPYDAGILAMCFEDLPAVFKNPRARKSVAAEPETQPSLDPNPGL
jgi:hypothetical protein